METQRKQALDEWRLDDRAVVDGTIRVGVRRSIPGKARRQRGFGQSGGQPNIQVGASMSVQTCEEWIREMLHAPSDSPEQVGEIEGKIEVLRRDGGCRLGEPVAPPAKLDDWRNTT